MPAGIRPNRVRRLRLTIPTKLALSTVREILTIEERKKKSLEPSDTNEGGVLVRVATGPEQNMCGNRGNKPYLQKEYAAAPHRWLMRECSENGQSAQCK